MKLDLSFSCALHRVFFISENWNSFFIQLIEPHSLPFSHILKISLSANLTDSAIKYFQNPTNLVTIIISAAKTLV